MGLSRDNAGRFLPDDVEEKKAGAFSASPFQSPDIRGVGMLMRWGIANGRKSRSKLKIGICGEHGGDADNLKFCRGAGMDYVSASFLRVPVARLVAAQVIVEEKQAKKKRENNRTSDSNKVKVILEAVGTQTSAKFLCVPRLPLFRLAS